MKTEEDKDLQELEPGGELREEPTEEELAAKEAEAEELRQEDELLKQRARIHGWRDKNKWKGDPEQWVDHKVFLERTEKVLPVALETIKRLENKITSIEDSHKKDAAKFGEYHKRTLEQQRKNHEREIKDLKAQMRTAVEEGDTETWEKLDTRLEELRENAPPEPDKEDKEEKKDAGPPDYVLQFEKENPWLREETENGSRIGIRAYEICDVLSKTTRLRGKAQLDKMLEILKEEFPERFSNKNRQDPPKVDTGGATAKPSVSKKGKTYADLPQDAKKACDNFVSKGYLTKEQYVADFFGA